MSREAAADVNTVEIRSCDRYRVEQASESTFVSRRNRNRPMGHDHPRSEGPRPRADLRREGVRKDARRQLASGNVAWSWLRAEEAIQRLSDHLQAGNVDVLRADRAKQRSHTNGIERESRLRPDARRRYRRAMARPSHPKQ